MTVRGAWKGMAVALIVAGCASDGELNIRPVGEQASAAQPVSARIALAQGHLALGNVALALDEFRRASREEPTSEAAFAGMARCYEMMGRLDLSRRYYEQALAVAPGNAELSTAFAASLEGQGQAEAAGALRQEMVDRASNRAAPVVTAAGSVAELPKKLVEAAPGPSATVVLPPAPAVRQTPVAARLERLSAGEVALVTSDRSPWIARKVAVSPRSTTIRFEQRPAMVVLNAARVAGIAARTRDYLAKRGFAGATIGDAPARRQHTLIRYPAAARARAERIAAQFPFSARIEPGEGPLTLLVGRDAAAKRPPRAG